MILIAITVIISGFLWGISEGMTMIQKSDRNYRRGWVDTWNAGARSHVWFRWYHLIDGAAWLGAIAIGGLIFGYRPSILILAGMFILGWEMKEIGIAYSRYRTFIGKSEHIVFFDLFSFDLYGVCVLMAHIVRLTLAATFLTIGG